MESYTKMAHDTDVISIVEVILFFSRQL